MICTRCTFLPRSYSAEHASRLAGLVIDDLLMPVYGVLLIRLTKVMQPLKCQATNRSSCSWVVRSDLRGWEG